MLINANETFTITTYYKEGNTTKRVTYYILKQIKLNVTIPLCGTFGGGQGYW